MNYRITFVVAFIALWLFAGCESATITIAPLETSMEIRINCSQEKNTQYLWGLWEISLDENSGDFEIIPLRGASFQANVTRFLQPPSSPTHLLTLTLDSSASDIPKGYIVCDVTIRHPFVGLAKWRGFDVRGIVMGNASISGVSGDGELWPAQDELRVINADGYSRWWNPTEFTTFGTIFGYTIGAKAPSGFFATGTVNGYKYFADGLGADEPISKLNLAQRGTFSTDPGINTRRYRIQFPMGSVKPDFRFNYAITASYSAPIDDSNPYYPVESFSISANMAEAFMVEVKDNGSSAYFENETTYGGDVNLLIEVYDWGLGSSASAIDEIAAITLESPTLFSGKVNVDLAGEMPGSSNYSRIFPISIKNVTPKAVEGQEILIRVVSTHPADYAPDIPGISGFEYPKGAPLAAYKLHEAVIASTGPQDNHPPEVGEIEGPDSLYEDEQGIFTLTYATDIEDGTNLTILWENDGDMDFDDDLDGNNKDLSATLYFPTKGLYSVIARAVDSGGLHADTEPYSVYVGGCPTEIHDKFTTYKLGDAPAGFFSRIDSAFQTVGPYKGQLLVQTQLGKVKRYDVTKPSPWIGEDYITLQYSSDKDFVHEIDVEDYSGRVIISMMNALPTFPHGEIEVYDRMGKFLTKFFVGANRYVTCFDTDENGDLWVSTWDGTDNRSRFQHYVYVEEAPYYVEDVSDQYDSTKQFQNMSEVWDIAISYTLDRIYALRGNYNQGIAPYGELYVYDMSPDGKLTLNESLQMLQVFPGKVTGSYNNWYGVLVDGKIEIDHANEKTEYCRLIVMAQRNPWEGWGHYFQVMDSDLKVIDWKLVSGNTRRYAFSIGVDKDPSKRPIFTSGYNDSAEVSLAQPPSGW